MVRSRGTGPGHRRLGTFRWAKRQVGAGWDRDLPGRKDDA